ncbi:MAG TPA: DUF2652 domain-containing protein, partial [Saprospiraceae bacterium]|nr:DUF2652 domain-containing protein [Saprospiraceae bacterium]
LTKFLNMKNASPEGAAPQQSLIFIPDISGFTQFVTETEISHSQHIIEELLEIIIDSNKIGLEVSEIEGDAILFYRFGKAPTAEEMLDQVKEMFSRFHMHLKKYETHRVCNCGACCSANNLAIKFIAHYGDITMNNIRQYKKLFGKEVIVAHRLLKNEIDSHQYSLFTDNLSKACDTWQNIDKSAWDLVRHAEQEYDSGKVSYCYVSLNTLLDQLPQPSMEDYSLKGMKSKMMECNLTINAPLETIFNVVADLPWRSKWLPGSQEVITDINTPITSTGQTHKCLANGPVIVSHDYTLSDDFITFTETDTKKSYCCVYKMKKLDENRTELNATMFLRKNFIKETMFKLMMKPKFSKAYQLAFENLKSYCESLIEKGDIHPYRIAISKKALEAA